jgi:hypothetical protein
VKGYEVIRSFDISELETEVSSRIQEGWVVQGGICVLDRHRVTYMQAIARSKEDQKLCGQKWLEEGEP